jgi:predicted amidohydrolase
MGVHLAGSLLLRDGSDIYNSMILAAPDGRTWSYDKCYPWAWERAYFRGGRGVTVAQTTLGNIGMLICWDSGHSALWRAYAGRVDLMLISSCPPDVGHPRYQMPDGTRIETDQLGPVFRRMKEDGKNAIRTAALEQSAWLGVPAASTVGCGAFSSRLPNGLVTWLAMLPTAPHMVRYLPQASRVTIQCNFVAACMLVNARGEILAERSQAEGEGYALADVELPAIRPQPQERQPRRRVSALSYLISDLLLPGLCIPVYRRGARAAWGSQMAPASLKERLALVSALLFAAALMKKFRQLKA